MLARIQESRVGTVLRKLDSWITWGIIGFIIGLALGVNDLSVWLLAVGLGLFIVYLALHGPARRESEGSLFAAGGVFMMAWMAGFMLRGLLSL